MSRCGAARRDRDRVRDGRRPQAHSRPAGGGGLHRDRTRSAGHVPRCSCSALGWWPCPRSCCCWPAVIARGRTQPHRPAHRARPRPHPSVATPGPGRGEGSLCRSRPGLQVPSPTASRRSQETTRTRSGDAPGGDIDGGRADGLYLDPVATSHQAHCSRHCSVGDVRLKDVAQVGHRSRDLDSSGRCRRSDLIRRRALSARPILPVALMIRDRLQAKGVITLTRSLTARACDVVQSGMDWISLSFDQMTLDVSR